MCVTLKWYYHEEHEEGRFTTLSILRALRVLRGQQKTGCHKKIVYLIAGLIYHHTLKDATAFILKKSRRKFLI